MRRITIVAVICVLFLAACGASTPPASTDAPGYWQPYPLGSGTCIAHGVTNVKDGTKAPCQTPPTTTQSH